MDGESLSKVVGAVDLVFAAVDDFRVEAVVCISGVDFSGVLDFETAESGGVLSAGGSKLVFLGVRDGGKK